MRTSTLLGAQLLHCLERDGAGDWLCALPSKSLGQHLRKLEFIMVGRYRLGMKAVRRVGKCPAPQCRAVSEDLRDHRISCGIGGERIARHNQGRDAIFQTTVFKE